MPTTSFTTIPKFLKFLDKDKRHFDVSIEGAKDILDEFTALEMCEAVREYISKHFRSEVSIRAKEKKEGN